jgi:hypothetical protein
MGHGELAAEERERIIEKLRVVAVAAADLWDLCSQIEEDSDVEIGFEANLVDALGGLCDSPASETELTAEEHWETFVSFSTVARV